ncbi:MAG TPA: hypothetical protein VFR31_12835, partial [Thermoanaerobaculia bacterium]|nr:hypothetical protein [Thermoanaerobaculia bacterium]
PGRGESPTPAPLTFPLSRPAGGDGRGGEGVRGSVQRSPETASPLPLAIAPSLVQRTAEPSPPAPAPTLSGSAASLSMPLARSASPAPSGTAGGSGLIQRQEIGGDGGGSSSSSSTPAGSAGAAAASAPAPSASGTDVDDLVEKVMRRLTRTLAVESERHGGRRWP